jgi:sugar phosphate isomerase/epimerase
MSQPRLLLTVIGDEIGPSLDEMISFCAEHHVQHLDMRTVDGQNLLGMPTSKVAKIGAALDKAGLRVPTFVSPLLKWAAPGKGSPAGNVDFAFDPATCPMEDPLEYACDVAGILGATRLRFFSYMRHDNFRAKEFLSVLERLMDLSAIHVTAMHLENEPACNIGSVSELANFFRQLPELLSIVDYRNLPIKAALPIQALLDIANSYRMGVAPTDDDIALLAPHVEVIHLKDYRFSDGRAVPLGDGDIPWAKELERLLSNVTAEEVVASIETHCPHDSRNATARSVAALRRIAVDVGVEIH